MRIRVLFLEDVFPKYQAGDIYNVPGGYARNYLIPKGLAALATTDQLRKVEKIRVVAGVKRDSEAQRLNSLGERVDGLTIPLEARAGGGGRLYGSITSLQIIEEIKRVTGDDIDRQSILLPEPIKELGQYQVQVQLGREITGSITVIVHNGQSKGSPPEDSLSEEMERTQEEQNTASADAQATFTDTTDDDNGDSGSVEEITGEVMILDPEESSVSEEDEGEDVRGESTSP